MPRGKAIPPHVSENIETIAQLGAMSRQGWTRQRAVHQRAVERVTNRLGRPITVYALLVCASGWVVYNTFALRAGLPVVDTAPFPWLQGTMTLLDAVVALMVLTAQNRQNREAEQRAHLELQVNLLAEQKATKIISLLEELRRDLPMVKDRKDRVAEALQKQVDPKAVLSALEDTLEMNQEKKQEKSETQASSSPTRPRRT
jgi:uncharacterized membrane protein